MRIFWYDPVATTAAKVSARDVDFLRICFCGAQRDRTFFESRWCAKERRAASATNTYDKSITHHRPEDEAVCRRAKEEAEPGAISRHTTVRNRAAFSKPILG